LLDLALPGRVLHAGCGTGELVRELCVRGVDAHGFDHRADLEATALREVAPRLLRGAVDAIPFGPADRFETLVAIDLFEHVPEPQIAAMVAEFARLGVRRVVARQAHGEFHRPGHVTLRPLSWWDRRLSPWFHRRVPVGRCRMAAAFDGDPSRYLRVYELVETPCRARPAATAVTPRHRT
jgi:trans-aconitate methyltransferase